MVTYGLLTVIGTFDLIFNSGNTGLHKEHKIWQFVTNLSLISTVKCKFLIKKVCDVYTVLIYKLIKLFVNFEFY